MFQMRLMLVSMFLVGVTCDIQMLPCDEKDQSSLLQLKHDLVFDSIEAYKLNMWNSSSDCCAWDGVTCRLDDGRVIAIELKAQSISGGIDDSSSPLFDLHHLQLLDLSNNDFNGNQIPSGIGKLFGLVHLDLSYSNFAGQVPAEISSLTSLLSLNLSGNNDLKLEKPKLSGLIRDMTRLTELRLDGLNMSGEGEGHAWGKALSSSLPRLQVLSLSYCSLSGPLHDSLFKLRDLTYVDFSYSNLSSEVPDFFGKLSNLTKLDLTFCGLYGKLPPSIFSLSTFLLSGNDKLTGTLPEIIGNTTTLTHLYLDGCGFSGAITNIRWENLENLASLDLSGNAFNGIIPLSLFSLQSLEVLDLSNNQFNGEVGEFPILSPSSSLLSLVLDENKLEGPIPTSIFNLQKLEQLFLYSNNFSGTLDLSKLFQNFSNLSYIDISYNRLRVIESVGSTECSSFPHQLAGMRLASCNLKAFPTMLTNHSLLNTIDLSDNSITGEIPNWIWQSSLQDLNLSHNSLIGFERSSPNFTFPSLVRYVDLSSNLLQGRIPLAPLGVVHSPYLEFLSLSNNYFRGGIPPSLCNISKDSQPVIDLSTNSFSGAIPSCLLAMSCGVLNLKRNNLSGNIPNAFQDGCSLQTLDLSDNHLEGTVPKSTMNCKALEVLNLGNNGLEDEFPFWLMNVSSLRVLVLRSNKLSGVLRYKTSERASGWPKLQIIDIAANNFSGKLPLEIFKFWTGMMGQKGNVQPKADKLGFGKYYQDTVVVNIKGFFVELVKILTIFTTIDFSCNHFEGSIPRSLGDLTSLHALNLSHNRFTGHIPSSFGNLKGIESLDLANNRISGVIPEQLASLTFLSHMNLSYNRLVGRIPTSTQLQSFPKWSYIGNEGLYGPPLDEVNCGSACGPPPDLTSPNVGKGINWQLICVEIGYVIGLGAVIGSLVFWRRWRFWFFEHVDRLLFWVFPRLDPNRRNHGKRAQRRSQMKKQ